MSANTQGHHTLSDVFFNHLKPLKITQPVNDEYNNLVGFFSHFPDVSFQTTVSLIFLLKLLAN